MTMPWPRWCLAPAFALASLVPPVLGLASLVFVPGAAVAQPGAASASLRDWLARVHGAAATRNYQGILATHANGGALTTSRIAHYCEGEQRFERVDALDGQPRLVLRHNDEVRTAWPDQRVVVVQQRDARAAFPALLSGDDQAFERYQLQRDAGERVAGHDADVLLLQARDALRFSQRLWVDKASGLMLRNDVIDERGRVLESTAFTDVAIDVKPQPQAVLKAIAKLDGWRVVRPSVTRARLEAEGWSLTPPVAGFRQISCVRREAPGVEGGMLQTIFADGLTHVSVFIEPYVAERHKPLKAAMGATHTLMLEREGQWITVVGDVPPATLERFAGALRRAR